MVCSYDALLVATFLVLGSGLLDLAGVFDGCAAATLVVDLAGCLSGDFDRDLLVAAGFLPLATSCFVLRIVFKDMSLIDAKN